MAYQFTCNKCSGISPEFDDPVAMKQAFENHVKKCNASFFDDIGAFHVKFMLPSLPEPGFLEEDVTEFRVRFMREELSEFVDAVEARDLVMAADALVDLTYVVLGTAYLMGIPFTECWGEVHRANMKKVRAKHQSESKRNHAYDVVKPQGWTPPDLAQFLFKK